MPGMDLNQNNRNYERDLLAERVNRIERFLESFDLELVEPVEGANKIRVNKLRAVDGRIQQTRGREIDIGTGGGLGLPSNAGKSKYMGVYLTANNTSETDNPALWAVDWLRAHA